MRRGGQNKEIEKVVARPIASPGSGAANRLTRDSFQTAEEDAAAQLKEKLAIERQNAEAKRLLDNLASLVERGQQTLRDASALPNVYETLAGELTDAVQIASTAVEEVEPTRRASGIVAELLAQLPEASAVAAQLQKRYASWMAFVRERDSANVELDDLREPLDRIEEAPLRDLAEAQKDLEELKVRTLEWFQ